jgi:hypothetical protein
MADRYHQAIDVVTGIDEEGNTVTLEEALWRLRHGWDLREVVCGRASPLLTPGVAGMEKRTYQIWIAPVQPVILLGELLNALRGAIEDGGDIATINMISILLTTKPLSYWGGPDVPAPSDDLEQDAGDGVGVRAVPGKDDPGGPILH